MIKGPARTPTIDRLMRRVSIDENSCWIWAGVVSRNGYGRIGEGGKYGRSVSTHRVAYQHFIGPIPEDLTVDHLCRNRLCVNPDHMELVTALENQRRGMLATGTKAGQTHCINGHEFDEKNTGLRPNGTRRCRTCDRIRHRVAQKEVA